MSKNSPFNSPKSWVNDFTNTMIHSEVSPLDLFSKYANDELVVEGFQTRQELGAEEPHSLENASYGTYFSDLCSGLHRLPNLQSIEMDDDIWGNTRRNMSGTFRPCIPIILQAPFSQGPLSRGAGFLGICAQRDQKTRVLSISLLRSMHSQGPKEASNTLNASLAIVRSAQVSHHCTSQDVI